MIVTFFGHRDAPTAITARVYSAIEDLIRQGADTFYVGNHGAFDAAVRVTLRKLQAVHPHIHYAVVLAYLPTTPCDDATVYPEGMECVPPRFAIGARNRWMVEQADTVVTYVTRNFSGAARYRSLAIRQGKTVIDLAP